MKSSLNSTLDVEVSIVDAAGATVPLAEQVFYLLEKSPAGILKQNDIADETGYARTINALRNHALTFFITDPQGRAEIKDLKTAIYYICGVLQGTGVWNVEIELKSGKNSLVLSIDNMTGKT